MILTDDAEKSIVSHTVLIRLKQHTCTTKVVDLTESTGVMPAKYPPKVKLEFLTTLECQNGVNMRTLVSKGIETFIVVRVDIFYLV